MKILPNFRSWCFFGNLDHHDHPVTLITLISLVTPVSLVTQITITLVTLVTLFSLITLVTILTLITLVTQISFTWPSISWFRDFFLQLSFFRVKFSVFHLSGRRRGLADCPQISQVPASDQCQYLDTNRNTNTNTNNLCSRPNNQENKIAPGFDVIIFTQERKQFGIWKISLEIIFTTEKNKTVGDKIPVL